MVSSQSGLPRVAWTREPMTIGNLGNVTDRAKPSAMPLILVAWPAFCNVCDTAQQPIRAAATDATASNRPPIATTASVMNESLAHFLGIETSIRNRMQISGQCPRVQPRSCLNLTGQPYPRLLVQRCHPASMPRR